MEKVFQIFQKYAIDIWDLLKSRVHKYIEENVINRLTELFNMNDSVGLLINERFLHFPPSIAAPAFNSLKLVISFFIFSYFFVISLEFYIIY